MDRGCRHAERPSFIARIRVYNTGVRLRMMNTEDFNTTSFDHKRKPTSAHSTIPSSSRFHPRKFPSRTVIQTLYSRASQNPPSGCSCHVRLPYPAPSTVLNPDTLQHKISSRRRRSRKAKHKLPSTCKCSPQPAQRSGYRRTWSSGHGNYSSGPLRILYKTWEYVWRSGIHPILHMNGKKRDHA